MIAPPPTPCRTRKPTSEGRLHAVPQSALATVKRRIEPAK
jgi:hypothetical protein